MESVSNSNGTYHSHGTYRSSGTYCCYGLKQCKGVYQCIFAVEKVGAALLLFHTPVSEERIDKVWSKIHELNNGWFPKFTNAFDLYTEAGKDWSKVDASKIVGTDPDKAWEGMPKQTIDFLKSLPEFDPEIFKAVTGIDCDNDSKAKARELREQADALLLKAKELESSL